ncbi:MAG: hypothetical protein D6748_04675 [Calditrichaeota bacterium]|nr:MAG: hypothetical protein D6748_04675 [Calditrichota bacterium]
MGVEEVVRLLQTQPFLEEAYEPVLERALKDTWRLLYLDVRKKRFLALDSLPADVIPIENSCDDDITPEASADFFENLLSHFRQHLSPEMFCYLNELLENYSLAELCQTFFSATLMSKHLSAIISAMEKKLEILKMCYPNGRVEDTSHLNGKGNLSREQVISAFVNVYVGIEKRFPPYFLHRDGDKRSRVVIRFLVDKILHKDPRKLLDEADETFFIIHKIQNIYRFYNYSLNRVLQNAYPDLIHPWLKSRCQDNYWANKENRMKALRWLVEEQLKIPPSELYRHSISREDFARHGLSFMFNRYYNSVSRALGEAYPNLHPWELGKVPFEFWTDKTAAAAIRWMIEKKGWSVEELPGKAKEKQLTRKTFSEYGLATLFEKKFGKNIYRAISHAYPGRFFPWEFGKVQKKYWESPENIFQASIWIALQEGIPEKQIPRAIKNQQLDQSIFQRYSIGHALKKWSKGNLERIFAPWLWRERRQLLREHKLLRKIRTLKKQHQPQGLLQLFLYGLFSYDVQMDIQRTHQRYDRIAHRIERRIFLEEDNYEW